jgi:hypothetical protein
MAAVEVSSWSADGQARIDLFWRDPDLGISHIGGDGVKWSGNRMQLGSVTPELPDALGGIHVASPAVATTVVQIPETVNPGHPATPSHPPWLPPVTPTGSHAIAVAAPAAAASHPGIVPSPVVRPTAHRMDVFGIGLDFAMYHQVIWNGKPGNPQPLVGWESLGGNFISAPAAIAWNDGENAGRVDVFADNAADRAMMQRTWDGKRWSLGWQSLEGIFDSAAAVVSSAPGRLDLFARATDHTLRHQTFQDGAWLPAWRNLGGTLASQPVAVSRTPTTIDVISVSHVDGSLVHRWWDGTPDYWNDWESTVPTSTPGVGCSTTPSVLATGPDRLDVVTLGSDSVVYHWFWRDGFFYPPIVVGRGMSQAPTLARMPSDHLMMVGGDSYDNLVQSYFETNGWTPPDYLQTGFGPTVEARISVPQRFRFSVDNVKADPTRAQVSDTDVGTMTVTRGSWPATTAVEIFQEDILDGSNYQPSQMVVDHALVELCEHVIFSYHIVNKSNAREVDPVDQAVNLEALLRDAAGFALTSIADQLGAGAKYISTVEVASLSVPVVGSILDKLKSWMLGELQHVFDAGYCDGDVAFEQVILTGRDLLQLTLGQGTFGLTTDHPGYDSKTGCGPTSDYKVEWTITRVL